jgi:hypothetical protein
MKVFHSPFLHLSIIVACAVFFNLLPYLVSGVPLQQQVLSDVEAHISVWQISLDPSVFPGDKILRAGLQALPTGQIIANQGLAWLARSLHIDLFTFSVVLSFCSLALFLCGLYFLLLTTLKEKVPAFLITFFSIIPVHALGSVTFGFQALGFLPRDLAATLAVFILILYFHAIERDSWKERYLVFLISGICANFYPLLFFHLALTLTLAEWIRARRIDLTCIGNGVLFLIGAVPTILDIALKSTQAAPIDVEIMRLFYKYMMVSADWNSLSRYLRRFLIYALLIPPVYLIFIRNAPETVRRRLLPWTALAMSAFCLSVAGVFLESTTAYGKIMLSRTSVWFILASMVIIAYGFYGFFQTYRPKTAVMLTVVAVTVIFLGQSNLPTVYRFLDDSHHTRDQKMAFHAAVSELMKLTEKDDVILAPTDEFYDLAASVRTYSLRSIYVCYKYGGISIMDGDIGREWWKRYQNTVRIFKDRDPKALVDFMRAEKIRYAFVPADYYKRNDPHLRERIAYESGQFVIIRL